MHEITILEEIIESVKKEAEQYSGYSVREVRIIIGKLRQFVPEYMEFYYSIITKDTVLENSKLLVEEMPIRLFCFQCESFFIADNMEFQCPYCFSTDIKMVQGNELILDSIELIENMPVNNNVKE